MITRAKVVWEVDVTLDVPERASTLLATLDVVKAAIDQIYDVEPKIVQCVERPDVITK